MEITINNRVTQVPQAWNEMTTRQQLLTHEILLAATRLNLTPTERIAVQKLELTKHFLGLTPTFLDEWRRTCEDVYETPDLGRDIYYADLAQLTTAFDWLFETESDSNPDFSLGKSLEKNETPTPRLTLTLTRCPYPTLIDPDSSQGKKTLHAPADALANVSIYELGMAFTAFEAYAATQEEAHLHRLLAILYRPAKPDTRHNRRSNYEGDRRLPLLKHESTIPSRAQRMATLPKPVKRLLIFWFASCRRQILSSFPNLFTPAADAPAGERVGNDYGWGGLLLSLAGGLVHLDEVSQQSYGTALTYLSYLEDQRKLREIRSKRSRP